MTEKTVRPRGTDCAKQMTVIVTESLRGLGTREDLSRIVREIWTLKGEKIGEYDPAHDYIRTTVGQQEDA